MEIKDTNGKFKYPIISKLINSISSKFKCWSWKSVFHADRS